MLNDDLSNLSAVYSSFASSLNKVMVGYGDIIKKLFIALMIQGNILIEGPPGLGKTTLIKEFSRFMDLSFSRIQFTPDLMPLDIIGSNILQENEKGKKVFEFYKGPVFANIVLGDEINRATPKTQSACLEAMEEKKITYLGVEYKLPFPFILVATQNPIELEGTYPLPEAQVDRFFMKLFINYPDFTDLINILDIHKMKQLQKKGEKHEKIKWQDFSELENEVEILPDLKNMIGKIIIDTHPNHSESMLVKKYIQYGASPRAGIFLFRSACWNALLDGRINVSYDDIIENAFDVLNHRIILNFEGEAASISKESIIEDVVSRALRNFKQRA